jgi:hypothetical protein
MINGKKGHTITTGFGLDNTVLSKLVKYDSTTTSTSTSLYANDKKERMKVYEESEERGKYLFGIVFIFLIWSFSIPPELRRQHICFSQKCIEDNTGKLCYDCISFGQWAKNVSNYYEGGGGVNFDFSIEKKD